ncbi:class Ib ribonucleoside-diphosphate reductase assembly flavoprotein NrdI [Paeniglutamicibacter kerguelensis]|uniref:Protein NrdI n=1 Tax=Paeniglutamicibacter kerguelensis TaxID=254788 RepID=A0ABS4XCZ5_9MICC|nr:class Ib ribonucleoside-diphosphate reductase assembly flavoprotein NrdI [Paeniglutamicibacter kerguelensis]MBP2386347.1 protein involved in ribonucleotide reduction [Paeniglutamicibacter kerguelensis]
MPTSSLATPMQGHAPAAEVLTSSHLIYFSSASGYTHRFAGKLGIESARIPLHGRDPQLVATEPFVLLLPTYGGEKGERSIPPQVVKFLNDARNRNLLRGVVGAGNTNFGTTYCLAAIKIAAKCNVPLLYKFELMGTQEDVTRVREGLEVFWTRTSQSLK